MALRYQITTKATRERVVPGLRRSCDGTMLHDVEPMGWTQMPDGMTMLSCYPVRGRVSIARRIHALIVLACDCLALEVFPGGSVQTSISLEETHLQVPLPEQLIEAQEVDYVVHGAPQ
ncbi:hypothetical protein DPMN_090955 [Dreissena polymorpha]|uniref:Uncharacterized protein n=1 Tax=Dreissena polymorpha TaxID=45954 RepID=A0A9D4L0Q5_DREPO|nr:hypothetical protein DPMN_090955 [Dreissena polymorpha]